jgi:hypothetical protein
MISRPVQHCALLGSWVYTSSTYPLSRMTCGSTRGSSLGPTPRRDRQTAQTLSYLTGRTWPVTVMMPVLTAPKGFSVAAMVFLTRGGGSTSDWPLRRTNLLFSFSALEYPGWLWLGPVSGSFFRSHVILLLAHLSPPYPDWWFVETESSIRVVFQLLEQFAGARVSNLVQSSTPREQTQDLVFGFFSVFIFHYIIHVDGKGVMERQ